MKKRPLLGTVFVTIFLCSSVSFALAPMGEPAAGLIPGQFSAGVDYSYSKIDLKMNHGFSPGGGPSVSLDNLKKHYVIANIGYGIKENWDLFYKVGGGSAQDKEEGNRRFKTNRKGYIMGFGTKATFHEEPDIKWGGLFQALWAQSDGRAYVAGAPWTAEINYMEIQIAAGPTYRLNDKMSLYGGPFFHIFDGHFTAKRRTGAGRLSYDLDQGSCFGGYIGTGIKVTSNADFNIEYQHTAAADALGMGLTWKF